MIWHESVLISFSLVRLLAKCTPTLSNKVSLCITSDCQLWLTNGGDEDVTLAHGELFGFGVGDATEMPLGRCDALLF